VFWDPKVAAGQVWHDVIDAALREARCVIVGWSSTSLRSQWVRDEASEGLERGILVPVLFENVRPPLGFRQVQTANLTDWDGDTEAQPFPDLLAAVKAIVDSSPVPGLDPDPIPSGSEIGKKSWRRSNTWAVAAFLLLIGISATSLVAWQYWDETVDGSLSITEPAMVDISEGSFQMGGSDGEIDEKPAHRVALKAFRMGRYEVTFDEYDQFAIATGRRLLEDEGWGRGKRPVIHISFEHALAYAKWLSKETGKQFRLPTEAEWEYAARAGTGTDFWWGLDIGTNRANCQRCGSVWDNKQTAPVGSFEANPWGLNDTAGNVAEWVADCYHGNYQDAPSGGNSPWQEESRCESGLRVIRGGSWGSYPTTLRSAYRHGYGQDYRYNFLGFRLAQDLN
jgi:formylglycine-generating enzyme required for sulfatase activity